MTHMKMQMSVIFVKKKLKINMWKIKDIIKLEHEKEEYRGAANSTCNLTLFTMGIFGAAHGWERGGGK